MKINRVNLETRRILVTGAAGLFGQAIVGALVESGAQVIANGRDANKLAGLRARYGAAVESAAFDISDEQAVEKFFASCGALDGLVNNAYSGSSGTLQTTKSQFDRAILETGLVAPLNLMRAAFPILKKSGHGSIVNIASMYGVVAPHLAIYERPEAANPPAYGAAKAGLIQATRYAAVEFAKDGVRVNSVGPGAFPAESVQNTNPDLVRKIVDLVPMGRIGEPGEVTGAVLFFLSDLSSYVTGAHLPVDGGWTAW